VLLLTQRRPGHQQVLLSDLGQTEGIVALLENSFWGSPEPEAWRAHLGRCQAFSQFAGFKRASWPEGHEELGAAARDYKEMVTSKAEAPASGLPANQA